VIHGIQNLAPQRAQSSRENSISSTAFSRTLTKIPLLTKRARNGEPISDIFQEIPLAFVVAAAEVVDEHLFDGLVVGD
jgi:hypothetical protein